MSEKRQLKKALITINYPDDKNITDEVLQQRLHNLTLDYWCLSKEIGESGNPHFHIFLVAHNSIRFSTLKRAFPEGHIDQSNGSSQENRDYITKTGKWANSEKATTSLPDTFHEWGELPDDARPAKADRANRNAELMGLIAQGLPTAEILLIDTSLALSAGKVDQLRNVMISHKNRTTMRAVSVIHIHSQNENQANQYIYERHPMPDVCRITQYPIEKGMRFDGYAGEPVIMFSRFRGQIPLDEMLAYLSPYPTALPARYSDRMAAFTLAYISSPFPLGELYKDIQGRCPAMWAELLDYVAKAVTIEPSGHITETILREDTPKDEQTEQRDINSEYGN